MIASRPLRMVAGRRQRREPRRCGARSLPARCVHPPPGCQLELDRSRLGERSEVEPAAVASSRAVPTGCRCRAGNESSVAVPDRVLQLERRARRIVEAQRQELFDTSPAHDLRTGSGRAGGAVRRHPKDRGGADGLAPRRIAPHGRDLIRSTGSVSAVWTRTPPTSAPRSARRPARPVDRIPRSRQGGPVEMASSSATDRRPVPAPSGAGGHAHLDDSSNAAKPSRRGAAGRRPVSTPGVSTVGELQHPSRARTDVTRRQDRHDDPVGAARLEAQPRRWPSRPGPVEIQVGSLATGERSMLRGCKLGNGAYGVVRHGGDHMHGV